MEGLFESLTESPPVLVRAMEDIVPTVEPIGMGLRIRVSTIQTAFYIILVVIGILGNATIIGVIGDGVIRDQGGGRSSDMILVNMAFSNLMVSITRNALLVISDLGAEVGEKMVGHQGKTLNPKLLSGTLTLN